MLKLMRNILPIPHDPNSRNVTIGTAAGRGRGVFAVRKILKGEVIERAPVIVIPKDEWPDLESTTLSDYAFDWGENDEHAAIALGYVSIYNHSYLPNAELDDLLDEQMMSVVARHDIQPGEEITINYNGDPTKQDPLWFTD